MNLMRKESFTAGGQIQEASSNSTGVTTTMGHSNAYVLHTMVIRNGRDISGVILSTKENSRFS